MGDCVKEIRDRLLLSKSYPEESAYIIRNEDEALEIAGALKEILTIDAAKRDFERSIPSRELDIYSQSGLWSVNIPKEWGGADLSWDIISKIVAIVAEGDPSIAQLIQSHLDFIDTVRTVGNDLQKEYFFPRILAGMRTGNAFSESGTKNAAIFSTSIKVDGENYKVNGVKQYCSGAYLSHVIPIMAVDKDNNQYIAVADRGAEGINVDTNWSSFGQRTTVSGTTVITDVVLPAVRVFRLEPGPNSNGAICQIIHAAVDVGIARSAFNDAILLIREHARPWIDSESDRAVEDPHTQFQIGDIAVKLIAAEALLARSGRILTETLSNSNAETIAAASVAVAEAKVLSTEVALLASNKLFELAGARSARATFALDRHWRNARTHTLHDPVRWKYNIIGNFYLNHIVPPTHSWI